MLPLGLPLATALALARVTLVDPLRLDVASRRLVDGTEVVALHIGDQAEVEDPTTTVKVQVGSFKFGQVPIGRLVADENQPGRPLAAASRSVGERRRRAHAS